MKTADYITFPTKKESSNVKKFIINEDYRLYYLSNKKRIK